MKNLSSLRALSRCISALNFFSDGVETTHRREEERRTRRCSLTRGQESGTRRTQYIERGRGRQIDGSRRVDRKGLGTITPVCNDVCKRKTAAHLHKGRPSIDWIAVIK